MIATLFLPIAAFVSFVFRLRKVHAAVAWLLGCAIVPGAILIEEFLLPYKGGGASMWPIALAFGSLYGAVASALGVLMAKLFLRSGPKNA